MNDEFKKTCFLEEIIKSKVNSCEKGSAKYRKQDSGVVWEEDLIRSRGIPLMGGSCVGPGHSTQLGAKLSDFRQR